MMTEIEERLAQLEIRFAYQDDIIDSLNQTIATLQQNIDKQQAQLRLLAQQLQEIPAREKTSPGAFDEIPPHY